MITHLGIFYYVNNCNYIVPELGIDSVLENLGCTVVLCHPVLMTNGCCVFCVCVSLSQYLGTPGAPGAVLLPPSVSDPTRKFCGVSDLLLFHLECSFLHDPLPPSIVGFLHGDL